MIDRNLPIHFINLVLLEVAEASLLDQSPVRIRRSCQYKLGAAGNNIDNSDHRAVDEANENVRPHIRSSSVVWNNLILKQSHRKVWDQNCINLPRL